MRDLFLCRLKSLKEILMYFPKRFYERLILLNSYNLDFFLLFCMILYNKFTLKETFLNEA